MASDERRRVSNVFFITCVFLIKEAEGADIDSACGKTDDLDNLQANDRVVIRSQYDGSATYAMNQRCRSNVYVRNSFDLETNFDNRDI